MGSIASGARSSALLIATPRRQAELYASIVRGLAFRPGTGPGCRESVPGLGAEREAPSGADGRDRQAERAAAAPEAAEHDRLEARRRDLVPDRHPESVGERLRETAPALDGQDLHHP